VGGKGTLEVDANTNPLRDGLAPVSDSLQAGNWQLSDAPGLGIETMPSDFKRMQTMHQIRRL
jgi:hypothetical protein